MATAGELNQVSIKALDPHGKLLPGIRFTFGNVQSLPTTDNGVTLLQVPPLTVDSRLSAPLEFSNLVVFLIRR